MSRPMALGNGKNDYATIEYHGSYTTTELCLGAIRRILNNGDRVTTARLLSCSNKHCFLLTVNEHATIAIPAGFTSGYSGEGSRGLTTALRLLDWYGADIEEYEVPERVVQGINDSCLKAVDLEFVLLAEPIRPQRWHDYVYKAIGETNADFRYLRELFAATLPLGVVDGRLGDLVIRFREDPDAALHIGYRRLEDTVRERAGLRGEAGVNLMAKAFQGDTSALYWPTVEVPEQKGRASLFTGAFMAFRNPRAHREDQWGEERAVREFLILNELFRLEAESVVRVSGQSGDGR